MSRGPSRTTRITDRKSDSYRSAIGYISSQLSDPSIASMTSEEQLSYFNTDPAQRDKMHSLWDGHITPQMIKDAKDNRKPVYDAAKLAEKDYQDLCQGGSARKLIALANKAISELGKSPLEIMDQYMKELRSISADIVDEKTAAERVYRDINRWIGAATVLADSSLNQRQQEIVLTGLATIHYYDRQPKTPEGMKKGFEQFLDDLHSFTKLKRRKRRVSAVEKQPDAESLPMGIEPQTFKYLSTVEEDRILQVNDLGTSAPEGRIPSAGDLRRLGWRGIVSMERVEEDKIKISLTEKGRHMLDNYRENGGA